jgi:hypothetical protein
MKAQDLQIGQVYHCSILGRVKFGGIVERPDYPLYVLYNADFEDMCGFFKEEDVNAYGLVLA